jgi:hypothetical protein
MILFLRKHCLEIGVMLVVLHAQQKFTLPQMKKKAHTCYSDS